MKHCFKRTKVQKKWKWGKNDWNRQTPHRILHHCSFTDTTIAYCCCPSKLYIVKKRWIYVKKWWYDDNANATTLLNQCLFNPMQWIKRSTVKIKIEIEKKNRVLILFSSFLSKYYDVAHAKLHALACCPMLVRSW